MTASVWGGDTRADARRTVVIAHYDAGIDEMFTGFAGPVEADAWAVDVLGHDWSCLSWDLLTEEAVEAAA